MAGPQNIAELQQAFQTLQEQLNQAQGQISTLSAALGQANEINNNLRLQLHGDASFNIGRPRLKKPETFTSKDSVRSWCVHMDNYLQETPENEGMSIAASYLGKSAHEWWIVFQTTSEGRNIRTWPLLKEALIKRFQPLDKVKLARDKLAKWKQVKDVATFNEDFLRIILEIPHISMEEQVDRYTRGLKPYIWKELCTRDYEDLSAAMRDAERVESAHRRFKHKKPTETPKPTSQPLSPTPMDIGNITLKKLTPAEREQCRKEGRCFRCRQKGHTAKDCPKAKRN